MRFFSTGIEESLPVKAGFFNNQTRKQGNFLYGRKQSVLARLYRL
jgi:hypothetical protein